MSTLRRKDVGRWRGVAIGPGESGDVRLNLGESYSGEPVVVPVHVRRGREDGPTVFVTAALHGDEINGAGAIRTLIRDARLKLRRGSLVLVPVLNLPGFERHTRHLPDRRDLNRCFPGSASGSLASRMAHRILNEIVARCDFGIDLHTAGATRTNFPNLRADLTNAAVREFAQSFGPHYVISSSGPKGSLRREACAAGCPTVVFEGGEVWKVEPGIVECAVDGVRSALASLGMIPARRNRQARESDRPLIVEKTKWVRADRGGFLTFHVPPGHPVRKGDALATNTSLLGRKRSVVTAPFDGVVIGMTTLPAISPGEPIYHIGSIENPGDLEIIRERMSATTLHGRVARELASNVLVVER